MDTKIEEVRYIKISFLEIVKNKLFIEFVEICTTTLIESKAIETIVRYNTIQSVIIFKQIELFLLTKLYLYHFNASPNQM